MSEIDDKGNTLSTFTDVEEPYHLLPDMTGHVLVADTFKHRILLLDSQLQLERVLVDRNSQVKIWRPEQQHLNELTSQLYIVHCNRSNGIQSNVVTQWSLPIYDD